MVGAGAIEQIKKETTKFDKEKTKIKHQFKFDFFTHIAMMMKIAVKQYLLYRQKMLTKRARIQISRKLHKMSSN